MEVLLHGRRSMAVITKKTIFQVSSLKLILGKCVLFADGSASTLLFSDLAANRTLDMIEEFTSVEINDTRKPFLAVLSWPSIHGPFTVSIYSCNFFNIGL